MHLSTTVNETNLYLAFPVLGTYAEPVKGSIIVWNNLKRNGRRDERMYHGGNAFLYRTEVRQNRTKFRNCSCRYVWQFYRLSSSPWGEME